MKKNGKVRNVECGIHDIIKIMITLEKTKTCNLCLSLKFLALVSDDVEKLELQICTYMQNVTSIPVDTCRSQSKFGIIL